MSDKSKRNHLVKAKFRQDDHKIHNSLINKKDQVPGSYKIKLQIKEQNRIQ